ncbi:putative ankyrin repeat-containing domain, PGG domain, protein accelerated cell death 6 [Medicago truncatula]|nr:ankyrin repeat protein [Medicago truncatula]RHN57328.1 putative ankyrin repeat-containing domain, PGG domain, protein accelerated cell death 6 [Medicago truncatula]
MELKLDIEPSEVTEIIPWEVDNQVNLLSEAYHLVYGGSTNLLGSSNLLEIETPTKNTVLHIAASYGNNDIVNLVIEHSPKLLFTFNKNNDSPLHVAARGGHISTVKTLLASYTNIERRDIKMAWLEYSTNSRNDLEDYDEVLNMEDLLCFVNKENAQGNTMLHEAMLRGKSNGGHEIFNVCELYKTEDWLKNSLASCCYEFALEMVNYAKKSVLYLAVENGDEDAVKLILENCPKNDAKPKGLSPIVAAIMKQNQEILSIILENKPIWIHLRDKDGRLPLHYAASIGYLEGVYLLLGTCKCCTIQRDNNGYFPIHLASYGGHVEVVKKLLEYCPDPREMLDTFLQQNILHIAASNGKHDVIRYILENQVGEHRQMINQEDRNGNTPLHLASTFCHPATVYYIVNQNKEKVHLDIVNQNNETALDTVGPLTNNSRFKKRLTSIALKSAGAKRSPRRSAALVYIEQEHEESQRSNANSTKTEQKIKRKELHQQRKEKEKEKEKGLDRYRDRAEKVPNNIVPQYLSAEVPNPTFKDMVETLILVSTLIITASVAACFAVPGEADGKANNLCHAMFQAFIIFITISLFSSISSIIILFWATLGLTELVKFSLKIVMPILGIALISLSLAFIAGLYTVISELTWLANVFLVMTLIFVVVEILLYMLLFLPSSSTSIPLRYISYYPFLFLAWILQRTKIDHGVNPWSYLRYDS